MSLRHETGLWSRHQRIYCTIRPLVAVHKRTNCATMKLQVARVVKFGSDRTKFVFGHCLVCNKTGCTSGAAGCHRSGTHLEDLKLQT